MSGHTGAPGGEGPEKDDPVLVVGVMRGVEEVASRSANGEARQDEDDKGAYKGWAEVVLGDHRIAEAMAVAH